MMQLGIVAGVVIVLWIWMWRTHVQDFRNGVGQLFWEVFYKKLLADNKMGAHCDAGLVGSVLASEIKNLIFKSGLKREEVEAVVTKWTGHAKRRIRWLKISQHIPNGWLVIAGIAFACAKIPTGLFLGTGVVLILSSAANFFVCQATIRDWRPVIREMPRLLDADIFEKLGKN